MSIGEARVVEFGAEVMVVEDEPRTVPDAQPPGDWPEDVWWVARLQHVELARATGAKHQPRRRQERVDVLHDEAERSASGRVRAVLQQRDTVEDFMRRVAFPFWADDGDVVARFGQGPALEPDPTVEGDREVLDDDQSSGPGIRRMWAGHTTHPIPS